MDELSKEVLSMVKGGLESDSAVRTAGVANIVGSLYWAACLTMLFFGVTLVPAHVGTSLAALPAWGVLQLVVFAALWAAAAKGGERADVFSWSSGSLLCGLFVGGMAWVCLVGAFGSPAVPWAVRILPCALCMTVATPLAMVHVVQYCKSTGEQDFITQSVPGALMAAFLTFFPLDNAPLTMLAISIMVAALWMATHRALGPLKAACRTVDAAESGFSAPAVLVAAVALFLAGGMICPLTKNPVSLASFRYDELFALALGLLLFASLLVRRRFPALRISVASRAFALASGLAYLVFGVGAVAISGLIAAVLLGAFLVNAGFLIYTLSLYILSDERATTRFWLGQIVVFASYLGGLTGSAYLIRLSGNVGISPFVMASLFLLLVFAYAFDGAWAAGARREIQTARVVPDPAAAAAAEEEVGLKCEALAARAGLTAKEREVLQLMARGWNVPMIARSFVVSQTTVRTHVKHVYQKLDVHSRDELFEAVAREPLSSPQE